jgi:hypothetical protein
VFSFAHNDRGIVKGYYIWARQDQMGGVIDKGTVKGIDAIDKLRNEYILQGWRILMKNKVVVRQHGEKKKEKKEKPVEHVTPPPNSHEDQAREEMLKKLAEHDAKMFF